MDWQEGWSKWYWVLHFLSLVFIGDACTAFAKSFTRRLIPCTLREVPIIIRRSGLRPMSLVEMVPISSPRGWISTYNTMLGRRVPTASARAFRAIRDLAMKPRLGSIILAEKNAHTASGAVRTRWRNALEKR